jgi:hypothetical protein
MALILLWQILISAPSLIGKPEPWWLSVFPPVIFALGAIAIVIYERWNNPAFEWRRIWRRVAIPTLAPSIPFISHSPSALSWLRDLIR